MKPLEKVRTFIEVRLSEKTQKKIIEFLVRLNPRFDAEQWQYRGNGAVDVLPDVELDPRGRRNVILYGNADTNAAYTDAIFQGGATFANNWSLWAQVGLASPGLDVLVPTQRHAEVAGQTITELPHLAGNLLHDAHTAILMREHGIRTICTRDTDFHRFPFLEVIDPLQS